MMPLSSWFCSIAAADGARDADAVAAHLDRLLLAVGVEEGRAHRLAVLGAEVEDLADLDAAVALEDAVRRSAGSGRPARACAGRRSARPGRSRSWSTPTRCWSVALAPATAPRMPRERAIGEDADAQADRAGEADRRAGHAARPSRSSASVTALAAERLLQLGLAELVVAAHQRRDHARRRR